MLKPAQRDLKVYVTGTFNTTITLWKSLEPLEQFPLGEYTTSLVVEGVMTLTPGSGITINENKIEVALTPTQTSAIVPGTRAHYYIKLVKGGEVVFPMHGTISFVAP